MTNAIWYLTYDGVYNFTSGIGTQTRTFLGGLAEMSDAVCGAYGETEVNVVVPRFDPRVKGFDAEHLERSMQALRALQGRLYQCASVLDKPGLGFWAVENWQSMCRSAARIIDRTSSRYDRSIVLAVDPPFLQVPWHLQSSPWRAGRVDTVLVMYTSSFIHDSRNMSMRKLQWEFEGLAAARLSTCTHVADIGVFMTDHLLTHYGVDPGDLVPFTSSLALEDPDFGPRPLEAIRDLLRAHRVPEDQAIVLAFGRGVWEKGFDVLLGALTEMEDQAPHLVLLVPSFGAEALSVGRLVESFGVKATVVSEFSRELPAALCQHPLCRAVVCPSRAEPLSNIPFEVALWARGNGPVVVASDVGGFVEQITDGENGLLFRSGDHMDLRAKLDVAMTMGEGRREAIRNAAFRRVVRERDFSLNMTALLRSLWG